VLLGLYNYEDARIYAIAARAAVANLKASLADRLAGLRLGARTQQGCRESDSGQDAGLDDGVREWVALAFLVVACGFAYLYDAWMLGRKRQRTRLSPGVSEGGLAKKVN
jgi:hypothetical protein